MLRAWELVKKMTSDEKSLLLYFETCLVDAYGKADSRRMNKDDFDIAKKWNESGFVTFGRIKSKDIINNNTHWVRFSEEAWELAHKERRARCGRMLEKATYERVGVDGA